MPWSQALQCSFLVSLAPVALSPWSHAVPSAMNTFPVEVLGLTRRFGRRVALEAVDLSVFAGEIVAMVGPNGSGKTTLLSILAGLLRAHGGAVRVFGHDPFLEGPRMLERARFAFAPPAFFPALTPREQLRHLTRIRRGRCPRVSPREIEEALDLVGLRERADDPVRTFSMGMKQRLALAQALLPRPDLIVLDEPTEGLDPLAVLELRAILSDLARERGVAILLSSHLMVEVEQLVDRLLVLSEGRSVFMGAPGDLIGGSVPLRLRVDPEDLERAAKALSASGCDPRRVGDELELPAGSLELLEAVALIGSAGVRLREFRSRRVTLEEALLNRLRAARMGGVEGGESRP